jgi:L-ascorbate metabolism protein UlaG (beta-lactamase superfamily)
MSEGSLLLVDPYLSDSLTEKYAATDTPHVRMTARVVAPEAVPRLDVIASTHNHSDHLDAATLVPLLERSRDAAVVVGEANRDFAAEQLGVLPSRLLGADDGTTVEVGGFALTGVAAAHEEVERDEAGRCRFLGYVIQAGLRTIYHSGDTLLYDGLAERVRPFAPDAALLPINGRDPARGVVGNMFGREAAQLAHEIRAGVAVPCHYDMFVFNTASPDEFVSECERLRQPYRVLRAGQRLTL